MCPAGRTWSSVPSPAGLPRVQLQLSPEEIGVDSEEFAESVSSDCSEWSSRGRIWKGDGFLRPRRKQEVTAVPQNGKEYGQFLYSLARPFSPSYRKGKQKCLLLLTWAPSARSRVVMLRRPLMALSTCSCRGSKGWEEHVGPSPLHPSFPGPGPAALLPGVGQSQGTWRFPENRKAKSHI